MAELRAEGFEVEGRPADLTDEARRRTDESAEGLRRLDGSVARIKTAAEIAAMAPLAAIATKEMVNAAFEMPLSAGIRFERRLFHGLFATEDQKEGMSAFVEKRKPAFRNR